MRDENNIHDRTVNGECSKCGGCCPGFIPLTKDEVEKIKRYVKKNNIKMRERESILGYDGRCIFLDPKTRKCMIYPVRPFVCSDFLCNREDWKEKRELYSKRAFYNKYSSEDEFPKNLATLDDLVYDNPKFLLMYLVEQMRMAGVKPDNESEVLIETLINIGRKDIADCIRFE